MESIKKEKDFKWTINYKGVSVTTDQDRVDCVIIYGNLLVEFLDTFSSKKISLAL